VLPNPNHSPTFFPERTSDALVSPYVRVNLFVPVNRVGLGESHVLGTPVPEATVDKDCDAASQEREIGLPLGPFWLNTPTTNTRLDE